MGALLRSPRLVLLGDFNIHAEVQIANVSLDFMDTMMSMGLSQDVTVPTHMAGHTLDLVFTCGHREDDVKMINLKSLALS